MRLLTVPMFVIGFVGLKTFLDNHMVLLPVLCIFGFILGFILLVKWNMERLSGRRSSLGLSFVLKNMVVGTTTLCSPRPVTSNVKLAFND